MKGQEFWPAFWLAFSWAKFRLIPGNAPGGHPWRPPRAGRPLSVACVRWLSLLRAGAQLSRLSRSASSAAIPRRGALGRLYWARRRPAVLTGTFWLRFWSSLAPGLTAGEPTRGWFGTPHVRPGRGPAHGHVTGRPDSPRGNCAGAAGRRRRRRGGRSADYIARSNSAALERTMSAQRP